MKRRGFFGGLLALLVAPQAIKADSGVVIGAREIATMPVGGISTKSTFAVLHGPETFVQVQNHAMAEWARGMEWSLSRPLPRSAPKVGRCAICHPIDPDGPPGAR